MRVLLDSFAVPLADSIATLPFQPDADSLEQLYRAALRAMHEAAGVLTARAEGDFTPDADAVKYPTLEGGQATGGPASPVTFAGMFESFTTGVGRKTKRPRRPKTIADFRRIFLTVFVPFIQKRCGHVDPARVTAPDVIAWCKGLEASGLSSKTVKDKNLAAVRAVYARAVRDHVLADNPAEKVEIVPEQRAQERERGFTEAEAVAILRAADAFRPGNHGAKMVGAVRWLPWIAAFTGPRVTEIAQLRGCDFRQTDDGWFLRITPEAGQVKTNRWRDVPVHPQLIERGLLDFVRASGDGPLFYTPPKAGTVSHSKAVNVAGAVLKWVRDATGVTDERVQPTHGWRHRFKTLARRYGMDQEARDYIQGHSAGTQAADYGDMAGLHREIGKLPHIAIAPEGAQRPPTGQDQARPGHLPATRLPSPDGNGGDSPKAWRGGAANPR